ncbi:MAG: phage portal protein [Thermomicrobiales bacterium]
MTRTDSHIDASWPADTLTSEDRARFNRYRHASDFASGMQWNERQRRGESRLTFNYAQTLLRKSASYVFPAPVSFSISPVSSDAAATSAAAEAEHWLNSVAARLDLAQLDLAMASEIATLGDGVAKVTWDATTTQPRVTSVDPASIAVRCHADDPRHLLQVTHLYGVHASELGHLFPDLSIPVISLTNAAIPVAEIWTDRRWQVLIAGQTALETDNPYGWIPYVFAANNPMSHGFWGRSDLIELEDVCIEINRRTTILSRVLELSGAPIAVLENVDGSDGISVGPGAKWELPEGAKAYLLDLLQGGGAHLHIEYIDLLFRILHDLSETPRTAFGDSGRDLSGAALEVEIQPLVQKVGRQRRMWEGVFARRNRMLLDLEERFGTTPIAGYRESTTIWPAVLPSDTDVAVRNAVARVGAGIQSRRSAIADLGHLDPDRELQRILDETSDANRP